MITGTYQAVVPKHGHRILLDIQMSSPVVVVPVTPSSAHVLVGYPGNIAVSNSFRCVVLCGVMWCCVVLCGVVWCYVV